MRHNIAGVAEARVTMMKGGATRTSDGMIVMQLRLPLPLLLEPKQQNTIPGQVPNGTV